MKKFFAVLVMIGICVGFFFSVRDRIPEAIEINTEGRAYTSRKLIEAENKKIAENYPATPQQLIESYNKLLKVGYGNNMSEEYVDLYIDTVSQLYSSELLEMNSVESLKETFKAELEDQENAVHIIEAKTLGVIEKAKADGGEATEVSLQVNYYTTSAEFLRTYYLKKEQDKWKIYSWKDGQM